MGDGGSGGTTTLGEGATGGGPTGAAGAVTKAIGRPGAPNTVRPLTATGTGRTGPVAGDEPPAPGDSVPGLTTGPGPPDGGGTTGGGLERGRGAGRTRIVTVTDLDARAPSDARYLKASLPLKPVSGVYLNDPSGLSCKVPWAGPVTSTALSASPSGSASFPRTPGGRTRRAVPARVSY